MCLLWLGGAKGKLIMFINLNPKGAIPLVIGLFLLTWWILYLIYNPKDASKIKYSDPCDNVNNEEFWYIPDKCLCKCVENEMDCTECVPS